jgi:16S rRNA (guanine527-N7)-methyltransferase
VVGPDAGAWHELAGVYRAAQAVGVLGDAPVERVIEHALQFVTALADLAPTPGRAPRVVDLGSGAGVPGLVVAVARPDTEVTLIDRRTKRTDLLQRAVRRLRLAERVTVVAADVGTWRPPAPFDAAVARGFGPPVTTLHLAARLVRRSGLIVISEPPGGDRWAPEWLDAAGVRRLGGPPGVAVFVRAGDDGGC